MGDADTGAPLGAKATLAAGMAATLLAAPLLVSTATLFATPPPWQVRWSDSFETGGAVLLFLVGWAFGPFAAGFRLRAWWWPALCVAAPLGWALLWDGAHPVFTPRTGLEATFGSVSGPVFVLPFAVFAAAVAAWCGAAGVARGQFPAPPRRDAVLALRMAGATLAPAAVAAAGLVAWALTPWSGQSVSGVVGLFALLVPPVVLAAGSAVLGALLRWWWPVVAAVVVGAATVWGVAYGSHLDRMSWDVFALLVVGVVATLAVGVLGLVGSAVGALAARHGKRRPEPGSR